MAVKDLLVDNYGIEPSLRDENPRQEELDLDVIYNEDCLTVLKRLPAESVNLVVTSPPYADNRKKTYGGIPASKYVEWFLPISKELHRVLKPRGSFVLNIKERVINGERGTYVMELVMEMRKQGWLWTEEYIWHKKNCYPGYWPNRFRDAWEHCYHFTKQKHFDMYQKEVMVPMGDWTEKRLGKLSARDKIRDESRVESGFAKNVSNWIGRDMAYPSNVLHMATECANRGHSATYPISLPTWFIKLFTKKGDVVLDPFMGSGTTAIACIKLGRHYVGMEVMEQYYKLALANTKKFQKATPKEQTSMLEHMDMFTNYAEISPAQ